MKRLSAVRTAAAILLAGLALAACAQPAAAPAQAGGEADTRPAVTLTDEVGRAVELRLPVQRAAIGLGGGNYTAENIRAIGAGDRIVAVPGPIIQSEFNKGYWTGLDTLPVTGIQSAGSLNYEEIIKARPEVLITAVNSPYQEASEKLAPFGIKVFVLTSWDPELFVQSVTRLGEIFGTQDRTRVFLDYYDEIVATLEKRTAGVATKKVYFENAGPGGANVTAVPGSGWHNSIVLAGGENIFGDITWDDKHQGTIHQTPIDPADILARNPDLVVSVNAVAQRSDTYLAGDHAEFVAVVDALQARPGWNGLTAVRDGRVAAVSGFYYQAAAKTVGALWVAKLLHPTEFADVDPDAYFRRWVEEFQGATYRDAAEYRAVAADLP